MFPPILHGCHERTSGCGQIIAPGRQGTPASPKRAGVLVVWIVGFWEEIDDGVESEGETTSFTDEVPEDSTKMFWRITDMGPAN